ncbi:unnamed protein product [Spirodela intermedia]|uniref:MYND-type domain-containing protein n=1 Tax=Spirodela intermedia TaxID=51605 RepID=A0A7I8IK19_SPIIN|nr:unnamed protein product [Spirodela intermedia]CAA6658228.1 unnamed protein product [Spirodela intermedia]
MEVHLRDLFTRFQEQFGTGPGLGPSHGTCVFKVDGAPPAFIRSLFRAAAALFRTDPWKRLRPGHLLGVRRQPFPSVQFVGGDGGDLAVHLFRSEQDALRTTAARETRRPVGPEERFPVIDVARFTPASGVRFRNPSLDELRFLYAFLKAVALVHPLLHTSDELPRRGRLQCFDPFIETVDVDWPPEVSRGWNNVAVTLSHPPGETYDERKPSLSPTRYLDPPREELPELETKAAPPPPRTGLRQCAMCEKEVQGEQSLCCGRCRAVVYCSSGCQRQHWKESHRSICGLYKAMMEREEELAMNIFFFSCLLDHPADGSTRRICSCYSHCPFGLLPARTGGHGESWGGLNDGEFPPIIILLSGWPEYYNLRSLPMTSPAVVILSHPLTVYHTITAVAINCKNKLVKGRKVIVHYLGPEGELDWLPAFTEIGHLLNGSGSVEIFMVGPEVPGNLSGTATSLSGGRVKVTLVRGLYQEEFPSLPPADVAVALNCRLESYGGWGEAVETIKSLDAPAFFTDRSEVACAAAKQILRAAGLHITHPVTPNPFRSPVRDRAPPTISPASAMALSLG